MESKKVICEKIPPNLLYPIFYECRDYTLDPYFQELLLCCSKGKFPKGFRLLDDKTICVNTSLSKNREVYDLPLDDPSKAWLVLGKIFREKLDLKSSTDAVISSADIRRTTLQSLEWLEGDSWQTIKSKKIRDQLILNFVTQKKKEYNLSVGVAKNLMAKLHLHINTVRDISPTDILYVEGSIENIKGVTFENQKFNIDCKTDPKPERIVPTTKNQTLIEKYIKDHNGPTIE